MAELAQKRSNSVWATKANEASNRFKSLPNNRKIILLAALAAVVSIVIGLFVLTKEPATRVLFADLPDKDSGQVVVALQQMNIPYQLGEGGVISVPANQVYDARLRLAAQGLPKTGGVGFELMDGQKFGISQFAEQVNYQRSIEGELARTIDSIASVQSARVHLAVPKNSVFVRDQQKTTASVMVSLFPGRILDEAQIAGIMHLVSSSVPNLSLKSISIVDQSGNLLSNASTENGTGLDQSQLNYVRQIEQDYTRRVEAILEPLFGKNNTRAQVTAELDFSQTEQTNESYTPNSSPNASTTRSQQIREDLGPGAKMPAGVPGALSNQPPGAASAPLTLPPGAAPGTQTLSSNTLTASGAVHREITTNYEVDKTISHVKSPTGQIKRISAAVVVNYKFLPDQAGDLKATALTEKEVAQITNLIRESIGLNAKRGDTINVVNAAFAEAQPPATVQDKALEYVTTNFSDIVKYTLLFFFLIYLIFGIVRPILRELSKPIEKPAPRMDDNGNLITNSDDGETVILTPVLTPAQIRQQQYEKDLEQARSVVRSDPRLAAQIIKEWISSDE